MNKEKESYINFLVNQIRKFQKDKGIIDEKDLSEIEKLLTTAISDNVELNKAINIPLAFLIGNAVLEANIGKKKIESELNNNDRTNKKQKLKSLKNKINVKKVIKNSSFLTKINDINNIIDDFVVENIPAIDCIISNNDLIARGYTYEGPEIIYEFHIMDENPTKKDVELISTKQIIETPENYSNKNKK